MISAIWKYLVGAVLLCSALDTALAHSKEKHTIDIGMALGLCDNQSKGINRKTEKLHKEIGKEIALFIDGKADKLLQELNNIIYYLYLWKYC